MLDWVPIFTLNLSVYIYIDEIGLIFACDSDSSFTINKYSSTNCSDSSSLQYTLSDEELAGFEFSCGGDDCYINSEFQSYGDPDCSPDDVDRYIYPLRVYVPGQCYNEGNWYSTYDCQESKELGLVETRWTDELCTNQLGSVMEYDTCLNQEGTCSSGCPYSEKYIVNDCYKDDNINPSTTTDESTTINDSNDSNPTNESGTPQMTLFAGSVFTAIILCRML